MTDEPISDHVWPSTLLSSILNKLLRQCIGPNLNKEDRKEKEKKKELIINFRLIRITGWKSQIIWEVIGME